MGFLARIESASFGAALRAGAPGPLDDYWFRDVGVPNASGVTVTADTARMLSAVWHGIRLKSEGLAGFPCHLFERRVPGPGKDRVTDPALVALEYLLQWQPNRAQHAFEFWRTVGEHKLLRGLFLAEIVDAPGTPIGVALEVRHPDRITPKKLDTGAIVYQYREENGTSRLIRSSDAFVVRGETAADGVTPMSFIRYGAQSLGITMAADQMAGTFFTNGMSAALAVIDEDALGEEGIKNLHRSVTAYTSGLRNAFGELPLEGKIKIEKLGFTPQDSQLLASRNFGIEEICRWLNVPLHMMRINQPGASGAYASLEMLSQEFVDYSLRPDAINVEHSIQRDLLRPFATGKYFAKFNMAALLRGNLDARAKFYQSAILTGYETRNEVRDSEDLNPIDGLDTPLEPQNTAQIDESGRRIPTAAPPTAPASSARHDVRTVLLAHETARRLIRRERAAVTALAKQHADGSDGWREGLGTFYADHAAFLAESARIPLASARAYAATQRQSLIDRGLTAADDWDWTAAETLTALALGDTA